MISTKQEIINALEQNQAQLKAIGIKRIGLFASFLHGGQRPDNDIGLLEEFEPGRKSFDVLWRRVTFLTNCRSIGSNCLQWMHSVRTLPPTFLRMSFMSHPPLEYLRYMRDETEYLSEEKGGLAKEQFFAGCNP